MLKPTIFSTQLRLKQMINRSKYQYSGPTVLNAFVTAGQSRPADCALFYRIIKRRIPEFRISPYMALFGEQFQRSIRKQKFCKAMRYSVVYGLHRNDLNSDVLEFLACPVRNCRSSGNIKHTETPLWKVTVQRCLQWIKSSHFGKTLWLRRLFKGKIDVRLTYSWMPGVCL